MKTHRVNIQNPMNAKPGKQEEKNNFELYEIRRMIDKSHEF